MLAPIPSPLSPHYYRDNFLRLCETVEKQYGDILNSQEQDFLERFNILSFAAQCLYVRLISRTGPWFRENKLHYDEIEDLSTSVEALLKSNMAMVAEAFTTADLGQLFTKPELADIFSAHLPQKKYSTKPALIVDIEELQLNEEQMWEAASGHFPGRIIAPVGSECVSHLQILFFGNRYQSLTQFVLEDLGVTRFYPYQLIKEQRFFASRAAFEEYLTCAALADTRYELLEQSDPEALCQLAHAVIDTNIEHQSSLPRFTKLCNRLGRDLERTDDYKLALRIYQRSGAHPARERSARIFEKTEALTEARVVCEEILGDPQGEEEREAAARILARVLRKIDGTKTKKPRDNFAEEHLTIPPGDGSVELRCAEFLSHQWQTVHYVENRLFTTLFGLAFWEEIFAPVPGVFHHPFQSVPSDMYDGNFARRRKDAVAARIEHLRYCDLRSLLCEAYERYTPHQCRWVDWRHIDAELIYLVATVVPPEHLIAIWERMLFDPKENRSGLPDLIALGSAPGDYFLIEVKGPGDTLQDSQKRWLRFFQAHTIPAQVAWVTWQDG